MSIPQNPQNPKIRVATSVPGLKDKLKIDLSGDLDSVYWYIRFNIPLDEKSVNEKTMEVTDTDGYIMRTDISYKTKDNRITISPLDTYEEDRYYLLKISRKVRSAKGQNLKTVISIVFKLYQGAISEYKILKKDVPVPPSKPRPKNYEELIKNRTPNFLDNYSENVAKRTTMTPEPVSVKIWVGILGIIVALIGVFVTQSAVVAVTGALICAAGIAHISVQWRDRVFRAKIYYNRGVKYFNRMQYQSALRLFDKALSSDPANELAKYGKVRVGMYKT